MDEPPVFPFRPQALAVHRGGLTDAATTSTIRATRWPLVGLAVLLLGCLAFTLTARLPRAVSGAVVGTDGRYLVAVFPGRLDPPAGTRATMGPTDLRVVRAETVEGADPRVPPQVGRPVTVVFLAGGADRAPGPVNLRVAAPTLFQMLTGKDGR